MLNYKTLACVLTLTAIATLGLVKANADGEGPLEFHVKVKLDTRTPDGTKTKVKATGMMTLHEDDGDFDIEATTKDGTTVTLSGTLGIGNKGAYGTGDLDLTGGLEAPLSVIVNGKLKSAGHVFKADLLGISDAPEFALTKGKISGHLEEGDGHDE